MSRQPFSPLPSDPIDPKDAMRVLDEPVKVTLSVQLTGSLAYETKRYCMSTQRSTAGVMREALTEYLAARGVTVVE